MAIIFLSGVHGVGKTTICDKITSELSIRCFSSSHLIKKYNKELISSYSKNVKNIDSNQEVLLNSIRELKKIHTNFVLDGHSTLLNSNGEIVLLESDLFKSLGINAIVALFAKPKIIYERLCQRDSQSPAIRKIISHQKLEILNSKKIANDITVDFSIHNSLNMISIIQKIKNMF